MPTVAELQTKRAKAVHDARAIVDLAGTAKRELTADESKNVDTLLELSKTLKVQIEDLERTESRRQQLADAERELLESSGRKVPDENGLRGADGDKDKDEVDEVRTWKLRGGGTRKIHIRGPIGRRSYNDAYRRYLLAGQRAAALRATEDREHRDLQADSGAAGGYLVAPLQMVASLIQAVDDLSFVRQYATVQSVMAAQSLGVASLDADPDDGEWTGELTAGTTDTAMTFGRRELNPTLLSKSIKVSRKLLRMAQDAESLVMDRLAYKFGITQEKKFLTGSGANQPLGIFTAHADGVPTSRDVSTGNTTTAITGDGLINAKYALKAPYRSTARWIFHRDAMKMISLLKDGNGQYLWRQGLVAGEPDTVLNMPVHESEYAPNTFTTGLYVGILADLRFYWIAEAVGLSVQRLEELYAATNQVGYIGRMELDGQPVLAEAFARVKLA